MTDIFANQFRKLRDGDLEDMFDNPFAHIGETGNAKAKAERYVRDTMADLEIDEPEDAVPDEDDDGDSAMRGEVAHTTDVEESRRVFEQFNHKEYTESGRIKYISPSEFKLDIWDPMECPPDTSFYQSGERRTGKSTMTKYLLWLFRDRFPWCHIFDGSASEGTYRKMVPKHAVTSGYDPGVMTELEKVQNNTETLASMGKLPPDYNKYALIWLDDVMGRDTHHNDQIERAYTRGRHLNLTVGFNSQRYVGLSPNSRLNSDVVIFYGTSSSNDKKAFVEDHLTSSMNFRTGLELVDMYTQKRHAIVVEKWRKSPFPEEFLKVIRAPKEVPDFKFGSRDFWTGSDMTIADSGNDGSLFAFDLS